MPEGMTGGGHVAHPRHNGFCAATAAVLCLSSAATVHAQEPFGGSGLQGWTLDAYLAAFVQLDRQEIAAIALTLGILCFAVVTSIMLVRTRRRLAETEAAARDEII